ncbi:MAG: GntR family transcriptional regulator [Conexivisphaerales archaeon]
MGEGKIKSFEKIKQRLLRHDVLSSLRAAILDGTFKPGERLNEKEIAKQMGVSRGPIREAIMELEEEGLVILVPHKGAFVVEFSADDVREIYSLRCLLEGFAAKIAAKNINDQDIKRLEAIIKEMEEAVSKNRLDILVEKDLEFHRELCKLSKHKLLLQTWDKLFSRVRLFLTLADQVYFEPNYIVSTHYPTIEALRKGDSDLAARTIKQPIIEVGEAVARAMEKETSEDKRAKVDLIWKSLL